MSLYAGLSLRDVYEKRCQHFGIQTNSALIKLLPETPDDFSKLTKLDLSANFVGCKGVLSLVEVIRCAKQLHTLNVSGQQLDKATLDVLCAVLRHHVGIRKLDVSENPINIVGGTSLLELLKDNPNIVFLNLDNTLIKESMTEMILQQLWHNRDEAKKTVGFAADRVAGGRNASMASPRRASVHTASVRASTSRLSASRDNSLSASTRRDANGPRRIAKQRPSDDAVRAVLSRVPSSVHEILFDENPIPVVEQWLSDKWGKFYDPQFAADDGGSSMLDATVTGGSAQTPCPAQRGATARYGISSWMRISELFPNAKLFLKSTEAAAAADAQRRSTLDTVPDGGETYVPLPSKMQPGFSWLYTSLNAIVDRRDDPNGAKLLQEMFRAPSGQCKRDIGVFAVRVYIDGAWRFVLVDDFLPVDRYGELIFTKPIYGPGSIRTPPVTKSGVAGSAVTTGSSSMSFQRFHEGGTAAPRVNVFSEDIAIWPCIYEKAMAKIYGGYEFLDTTYQPTEANGEDAAACAATPARPLADRVCAPRVPPCARTMADLTGGVRVVRALSPALEESHLSDVEPKIWYTLVELLSRQAIAASALNGSARAIAISKTEEEMSSSVRVPNFRKEFCGIALNREPYQVLQVSHINGQRLVQLQNRYTTTTWKGEWCELSMTWRQHPDIDRELRGADRRPRRSTRTTTIGSRRQPSEKGAEVSVPGENTALFPPELDACAQPFWMSFLDFVSYFSELHICRIFKTESNVASNLAPPSFLPQEDVTTPIWRERLLHSSWEGIPACFGHCEDWFMNPHFRLLMHRRGIVFINVCGRDDRFVQRQLGTDHCKRDEVAFHLLQAARFPIRGVEPAPDVGNPTTPLSEDRLQSTCLFATRYVAADSLTFEGILEECDEALPYWVVPSRHCGHQDAPHRAAETTSFRHPSGVASTALSPPDVRPSPSSAPFHIRVFSTAPFQFSFEKREDHWYEEVVEANVAASGQFMTGEDNPQVALLLGAKQGTVGVGGVLGGRQTPRAWGNVNTEESSPSTVPNGVARQPTSSVEAVSPAGIKESASTLPGMSSLSTSTRGGSFRTGPFTLGTRRDYSAGSLIVRATLLLPHQPDTPVAGGGDAAQTSRSPRRSLQRQQLALALFMTEGEVNHHGECMRVVGPLEKEDVVAQSLYILDDAVHIELHDAVSTGELYNILCCVQPTGTKVRVKFTIWSTLPVRQAKLLPHWPVKELSVAWSEETGSGAFYEASGNPQVEVYPVVPHDNLVVRMRMVRESTGFDDPTIMLTIVANHHRCGEGLVGRIPSERILARSQYVTGDWVQCEVAVGAMGMDSLLIIPCLQPARSRGKCVISVASESGEFHLREVSPAFLFKKKKDIFRERFPM